MLKALKQKFLVINMVLVFAVMTTVLFSGLITNHVQFTNDYGLALDKELSLDIKLPPRMTFRTELFRDRIYQRPAKLAFTAVKNQDGDWSLLTPWMQVDADTLTDLCKRARDDPAPQGFWADSGIAFAKRDERIAFINLQNEYSQLKASQLSWSLIYLLSLLVFALIILLLTRWALRPIEMSWNRQRQFVSDASHELKTPLTVILANLDILEGEQGNSPWLTAAHNEGLHMKKLIENLLFLAHSDEARQSIRHEKVCLSDITSETALAFEALSYENGLQLHPSITNDLYVEGDADLLRQLISILIDNAVKYTPVDGKIDISLEQQRDKLSLCVCNSNTYINKEQLNHLFDRFYRLDEARAKLEGGYGLGLSIASEIARQHGASLKANSSEEHGTCFTLLIQMARSI